MSPYLPTTSLSFPTANRNRHSCRFSILLASTWPMARRESSFRNRGKPFMDEQNSYPNNLPPDITGRNLPAVQGLGSRSTVYSDMESRYGNSENVKLRRLWQLVRKRLWMVIGITV